MTTRIAVVSDTHCHTWVEVHPDIRAAVSEADIAVHCGDIVRMDVVEGFRSAARRAVVVHGNSDPPDLRARLLAVEVLDVEGRRIGVTHPAWSGPEFEPSELLPDFADLGPVDTILYGHIHETLNERIDDVLYINPGQGYQSFMVPATIAVLTVSGSEVSVELRVIEKAR
jgi:hypothetical protein